MSMLCAQIRTTNMLNAKAQLNYIKNTVKAFKSDLKPIIRIPK